jgi:hypothetical protein
MYTSLGWERLDTDTGYGKGSFSGAWHPKQAGVAKMKAVARLERFYAGG